MGSTADENSSALSPAARQRKPAAGAPVRCGGVTFTVTEGNEVAEVARGGAARVLESESFLDAGTGTRHHFVDVRGRPRPCCSWCPCARTSAASSPSGGFLRA